MLIYIQTDQNKHVNCLGTSKSTDKDIEIDVPETHEVIKNPFVFKYENGQLIKDEAFQQQLIQIKEERENKPSLEQQLVLLQKAIDDIILGVM